jgi:hypothetical protein
MARESQFSYYLTSGQFDLAADLLKTGLKEAGLTDPRDDYSWGVQEDALGYRILAACGAEAFINHHRDFLNYFMKELEPEWGHLHKGHLYFRIGLGLLAQDVPQALAALEQAIAEDSLVAAEMCRTGKGEDAAVLTCTFPSYVAYYMIERLNQSTTLADEVREKMFRGMVSLPFEVAMGHTLTPPAMAEIAFKKALPEMGFPTCLEHYRQIGQMEAGGQFLPLPDALAGLLRRILIEILGISGKPVITGASLEGLIQAGEKQGLFSGDEPAAVFRMVDVFTQESYFWVQQKFILPDDPAVDALARLTLKRFTDRALTGLTNPSQ